MNTLRHLLPLFFSLLPGLALSQDASRYRAWLTPVDSLHRRPISITNLGDSGIWVRPPIDRHPLPASDSEPRWVPITEVGTLQFRRHGQLGRSLAIALPISMLVGALLALDTEENEFFSVPVFRPAPFAACTVVGLAIGLGIGSARTTFPIHGRPTQYQRLRSSINTYAMP